MSTEAIKNENSWNKRFAMFKDGVQVSEPNLRFILIADWMQHESFEKDENDPNGFRLREGFEIKEV